MTRLFITHIVNNADIKINIGFEMFFFIYLYISTCINKGINMRNTSLSSLSQLSNQNLNQIQNQNQNVNQNRIQNQNRSLNGNKSVNGNRIQNQNKSVNGNKSINRIQNQNKSVNGNKSGIQKRVKHEKEYELVDFPETGQSYGEYKGKTPKQAAKKAFSRLARISKLNNSNQKFIVFVIREKDGKRKEHKYMGQRVRLANEGITIKRGAKNIQIRYKNVVNKYREDL